MKQSMRLVVSLVMFVVVSSVLTAQQSAPQKTAPSVAGKWNMSVQSDQGEMAAMFTINLDGKKVTGTLNSDHTGEVPLEGTFEDGTLAFTVTVHAENPAQLNVVGKLKDDGTLTGKLTGPMGELAWTATRAK